MKNKGISLAEVLVVLAIIAAISAIIFPIFLSSRRSALETSCIQNVRNLYLATMLYREEQQYKVEFGDPAEMGLPSPESAMLILDRVAGLDQTKQSPCGRHPRMDDNLAGYATIHYTPLAPDYFRNFALKHEGRTPLWVDPNCSPSSSPVTLQYGPKVVIGVFLDGSTAKRRRSDLPFWSHNYFE